MTLLQLKSEDEEKNVIVLDDEHGQVKNVNKENEAPTNPSLSNTNANNNSTIASSNECQNFVVRIPRISNIDTESSIEIVRSNSQREASPSSKGQKRTSEHAKKKVRENIVSINDLLIGCLDEIDQTSQMNHIFSVVY